MYIRKGHRSGAHAISMKVVICTKEEPLALYSQKSLEQLGARDTEEYFKLSERTDVLHLLSYVAPCLGRGEEMSPEALHNLLLVSGFQHDEKSVVSATTDGTCKSETQRVIKGVLPSKAYASLPIEITVVYSGIDEHTVPSSHCHHHRLCRVDSLRFQIIEGKRSI